MPLRVFGVCRAGMRAWTVRGPGWRAARGIHQGTQVSRQDFPNGLSV
jgi:hypothetical protein